MPRICVPILAALFAAVVSGQTFTGNITGIITDPNAASVPGVNITVTNVSTGEVRTATSSETGLFTFAQLLPGSYTLKTNKTGFKEYHRAGIELSASQTAEVNIGLVLGAVSESVEVTAAAPLIDSQTANQVTTLNTQMVEDLPLITQNPFGLIQSMAGVTSIAEATGPLDQNWTRLAISGGRENTAQVLVDGIPAAAGDWGGLIATPGVGSVAEFQVTRNSYDAQFGRSGGGIISITTRGGSQQYHGNVYEYLQNDNLNANGFFNNLNGREKTESKKNQFGGAFSGPIWNRRHITGMFGWEALRQGNPASRTATLPTELERAGNFSNTRNANGTLKTIYDPSALTPDPARSGQFLRTPFPGNIIPTARMDRAGKAIMDTIVPLPNRPGNGAAQTNNFFDDGNNMITTNRYDGRVDWAHNSWHTLYGQFTIARQQTIPANFFGKFGENTLDSINPRFQIKLGNTFIISPTLVANVLIGASRWTEQQLSKSYGFDFTSLGFSPALAKQFDIATSPQVALAGLSGATFGNPRYLSYARMNDSLQANFTKEQHSHSIKFGFAYEASLQTTLDSYSAFFNFDQIFTSGPAWDTRSTTNGYSPASMLLGLGSGGRAPVAARPATADKSWALYIQNAWKVNPRLTINYGVRYEVQLARTERYNRLNYFDPNAPNPIGAKVGMPDLKGALVFVTPDNRTPFPTSYHDFAPRVGIAYKLTPKLVARTGYGIYFFRSVATAAKQSSQGYSNDTPWVSTTDGEKTPYNVLSNAFPTGIAGTVGSKDGPLTGIGNSFVAFLNRRPTPYVQQYSFDVQWEISRSLMMEAGYSGSQGRKLGYGFFYRMNQLPDQYLALGDKLRDMVPNPFYGVATVGTIAASPTIERRRLLRPFPQFETIELPDQPGAGSSFNALNVGLNRRFSKNMTLLLSYRFSKAIDNASETISFSTNDRARDFNNMRLDRSISLHDIPHSFALTYLYTLPVGRGQRFGAGLPAVINHVVGGWRLSGIYKLDSGMPLNFDAPDFTYSLGGSQYPDITDRHLLAVDNPTRQAWFNTKVVHTAAPYTYGNAPRWAGEVRTGRYNTWNLGMMKYFNMTERIRLQARADAFDALNHNRFGIPITDVSAGNFGQVTSTRGIASRIVQLGLKVMF